MIYKEKELKELQNKELNILEDFIRVCNILKCKYSLDGGTLIGCIRHKGFIPWDDDIDVCMPRRDYEKFINEGQKYLKDGYFIQNIKTDNQYTWGYSKIRDTNTTFIETIQKDSNINHGIYIDIFPIDGYNPNKKFINLIICIKRIMLNIQISKHRYIPKESKSFKKKMRTLLKTIFVSSFSYILYGNKSLEELIEIQTNLAKTFSYEESEFISNQLDPSRPYKKKYCPKEYFNTCITKEFETKQVKVLEKYDLYLRNLYGNYMELPPEEQRIPKHDIVKIDLNNSYKIYYEQREENGK